MANEVSIYDPRYLAEVVRTTPPVHTFFLDTYFSNIKTFPTKGVDIDIVKGDRQMASFVHPLVDVYKRQALYKTQGRIAAVAGALRAAEESDRRMELEKQRLELLRIRATGEVPEGGDEDGSIHQ